MIRVARVAAPASYPETKRAGDEWLRANPTKARPKDLWSPHLAHLADGFRRLCGYAAMLDPTGGSVDHFLSWKNHRHLAYEWSNFRHVSQFLNSSKRDTDDAVLDPYDVGDDWFEITLPSLPMQLSDKVPTRHRVKAEYTLQRLKLRDGEKIIRWRQAYYEQYLAGNLSLEVLRAWAPLIAAAVDRSLVQQSSSTRAVRSQKRAPKKRAPAKPAASKKPTKRAPTKKR